MFLDIAEKHYPQSLDLASSLNSIFANIGISIGSFTASQVVRFTKVANVGYFAAIYSLIALLIVLLITRQLKTAN
jgi:predicted MFS family arabinose efflux permease